MFYIRPSHSLPCLILFQMALTLGDSELDAINCLSVHFNEYFQHRKNWSGMSLCKDSFFIAHLGCLGSFTEVAQRIIGNPAVYCLRFPAPPFIYRMLIFIYSGFSFTLNLKYFLVFNSSLFFL